MEERVLKIKIIHCSGLEELIDWELEEGEDPEEAFNEYAWGIADEWRDDPAGEPVAPIVEWLNKYEFAR